MRRARRLIVSFVTVALTASIGLAPAASAQDTCTLLTVAEVEAAFGVTDVEADGTVSLCNFSGGTSLLVAMQPGGDLEDERAKDPDSVDATIGGHPALVSESARGIVAAVSGRLLGVTYNGDEPWDDVVPILTGLVELAIPRVPAGPGAEDIARLEALIPDTIGGLPVTVRSFGGAMLLGSMDPTAPAVIAFMEALTAQGKTADDVLFVGAETSSDKDYGATVALIAGADASVLVEPLLQAFASGGEPLSFAAGLVGGKPVTLVTTDENVLTVHAFGDVIFVVNAPETQLETIIANLPSGLSAGQSPSPEVHPGAAASPLPRGAVAPGTYTGYVYGIPVTFTVSDTWDEGAQIPNGGFWLTSGAATVSVTAFAGEVVLDPCDHRAASATRDATARSLIDFLAEHPALAPSGEPTAVEGGGFSGWRLDVTTHVPPECRVRQAAELWVESPLATRFIVFDGSPARFIALDTDQVVVVVALFAFSTEDLAASIAPMEAFLDSMVIDAEPARPRSAAHPVPAGASPAPVATPRVEASASAG